MTVSGLVACGGSSGAPTPAQLVQRCMTSCTRTNTVCGANNDCATQCGTADSASNQHTAAACGRQALAAFDCADAVPDAQYCSLDVNDPSAPCHAEFNATLACVLAASDAGAGGDAGM